MMRGGAFGLHLSLAHTLVFYLGDCPCVASGHYSFMLTTSIQGATVRIVAGAQGAEFTILVTDANMLYRRVGAGPFCLIAPSHTFQHRCETSVVGATFTYSRVTFTRIDDTLIARLLVAAPPETYDEFVSSMLQP